ncbi:hypothetical protein [Lacinutrix sp. Hel_I_90]|uniref:hypothetical protein n=1 Tax=Lacinutrix sp. Hel_I_90 TaxID=1249999 RepID=UPI0005CB48FB|nr:hypothetical protein [Lacinutrix sp. Hel_I_90]
MDDQDYIEFDQYLQGELAVEELIAFEARLRNEPAFEKEFRLYKEVHAHLQYKFENETETNAFKENLGHISSTHFNKTKALEETPKKSKVFRLGQLAIAASVVIFIGVFAFNQFSNPAYSDYNSHDPMTVVRGVDDIENLIVATKAFNKEDYIKANALLGMAHEKNSENKELQLYYAITHLELDNFKAADALLTNLAQGNSAYKYKATWYAALSQLKQKNTPASIALLKQIPEHADDYKQAKKLLNKLE